MHTVFYDHHQVQLTAAQLRQKRKDIGHFPAFNSWHRDSQGKCYFALKHSPYRLLKEKKVHTLLELVGLAGRADNYPAQLSGGQKQRWRLKACSCQWSQNPNSDESTSALDPKTTGRILALLQDLNQNWVWLLSSYSRNADCQGHCQPGGKCRMVDWLRKVQFWIFS